MIIKVSSLPLLWEPPSKGAPTLEKTVFQGDPYSLIITKAEHATLESLFCMLAWSENAPDYTHIINGTAASQFVL